MVEAKYKGKTLIELHYYFIYILIATI